MKREYLIYAVAVAIGFAVFLVLDRAFNIGFGFAMLGGFVAIHGSIIVGRRFL
jgi:predicted Zn-dependent protease